MNKDHISYMKDIPFEKDENPQSQTDRKE